VKKSTSNAALPPAYLFLAYLPPSYLPPTSDYAVITLSNRATKAVLKEDVSKLISFRKTCKILDSKSNSMNIILMRHALLQKYENMINFIHTFYTQQNVSKMCGNLCGIQMKQLNWQVVIPKCVSHRPTGARGVRVNQINQTNLA